ncbi:MAG: ribonuclease III [Oscillospiraceae bacterium]|nr:ribonuclease III [Oscillospiraceae bacterium]
MDPHQAKQYSPASMAFLGDAVYSELVRRRLLMAANMPIGKLHKQSVAYVRAAYQARAYDMLLPVLDDAEADILRRGRNSTHTRNTPKSADIEEYSKATALEALFGYLRLTGDEGRLQELFDTIWDDIAADSR